MPSQRGPGQQGNEEPFVSRPLPAVQCLAKELCARRGFDIKTHGALPSSGTILSVDDVSFDRALVLLSLFSDARVYADQALEGSDVYVRALSLRVVNRHLNRVALAAVVDDLAHGRTVIMSARRCEEIQRARHLSTPMQRVRIELAATGAVRVVAEAPRRSAQLRVA